MPPNEGNNPFGRITYGKMLQVSEHCYLFRNTVNSGVIISDDSVAVVDTQISEPMARRLLREIRAITDKPLRYAINTHYHWDHWAGNDVMAAAGAQIVSSDLTREFIVRRNKRQRAFLLSRGFSMPPEDPTVAGISFDGSLNLKLGKLVLELRHIGRAETDDATAIFVPSDGVALSGDTLMTGSFPILGQPVAHEGMGEDRDWIRTLGKLRAWGAKHIITGHGPLGTQADIETFIELQTYFLDQVEELVLAGLTNEEILAKMEAEMPVKYSGMVQVWGTPRYAILRALRSFRGFQHEKPIVIPEAAPADLEASGVVGAGSGAAYRTAADGAAGKGRFDLALSILKEGTRAHPGDAGVWSDYGRILIDAAKVETSVLEKGDYFNLARKCLEKAIELEPSHTAAHITLGGYLAIGCYRGGDDPSEAMKHLDKALEAQLEPREKAQVHFYRGLAYRAREEEELACKEFGQALKADPTFPPPRMAMAGDNIARPAGGPPAGMRERAVPPA